MVRTTEACARHLHFKGCKLRIPLPPDHADRSPEFWVDGGDNVSITYGPSAPGALPSLITWTVFVSDSDDPPYDTSGVGTREAVIEGESVLFGGAAPSRRVSWQSKCATYGMYVLRYGLNAGELDDLIIPAVRESLD